jgi:UDP-N-acetylmuramoyl-L-alanyl-D-glutamate--2,6-diaminopimelate ligase
VRLSALAADVPHVRKGAPGDPDVSAITHDSRAAAPGALFAAFPGAASDGRRFVADAVAHGAVAALGLAPEPAPVSVPYLAVENPRRAAGLMAALLAGRPAAHLLMAGITGTSGKTTTAYLVDGLLSARHATRGLFGTIVYRGAGGTSDASPAPHTTPEATDLQPMLGALVKAGGTAATLECSSHALVLERLAGCAFDLALFLNLSHEHLDFHRDLDDYFEAKTRLFGMLKPGGNAVVNLGDAYGRKLATRLPADRTVGFFLEDEQGNAPTNALVGRASLGLDGTTLEIRAQLPFEAKTGITQAPLKRDSSGETEALLTINSRLLGRPNAENLLAAAAAGIALGYSPDEIASAISSVKTVPGRLERIENDRGLTILVDYAHKPAALEGVLRTVRPLAGAGGGRVIVVFGCGGDRDRAKRPVMGRIAAELADEVVVTSDNPRSEDAESIIAEVLAGVPAGTACVALGDRRAAIAEAMRHARAGDVLLVAGKGHETVQVVGNRSLPFDDRAVLRELLAQERR